MDAPLARLSARAKARAYQPTPTSPGLPVFAGEHAQDAAGEVVGEAEGSFRA